jgi:hypothetical protein
MEKRTKLLISNILLVHRIIFAQLGRSAWLPCFQSKLHRDVISGTSPSFAYVQLMDESRLDELPRSRWAEHFGSDGDSPSSGPVVAIVRPAAWMRAASSWTKWQTSRFENPPPMAKWSDATSGVRPLCSRNLSSSRAGS